MTIEEKAKAYDEAIEEARKAIDCYADDYRCDHITKRDIVEIYADIFPELRESEDERIRKKLIGIFTNKSLCDVYNLKSEDVLAYLEKRKEQKSTTIPERIRPKFSVGDTVCRKGYVDHTVIEIYLCKDPVYICKNDEGLESHISFSEQDKWEKKEQKPAEHLSVRDDFDLEGNLKTKSAGWSDEDEGMLGSIIRLGALDNAQSYWLKRICSILRQQKPVEWSDGDENRFNYLLHLINESGENEATKKGLTDFINRIRSLGPQQWKPTDEQYYALRDAIIKLDADDSDARFPWEGLPVLHSLANDLFDLRKK